MVSASAIILAGGRNSRMNQNKAFLMFNRRPLIENQLEKLAPVFPELIVVTNNPEEYQYLGVQVVTDIFSRQGPLSGIHAGLLVSSHPRSLVVACDMPFVDANLAAYLVDRAGEGYDVVVPQLSGRYEPLYAGYAKTCLPYIADSLQREVHQIIDFYPRVRVLPVEEEEISRVADVQRVFFNVNTPAELAEARRMTGERGGGSAEGQG